MTALASAADERLIQRLQSKLEEAVAELLYDDQPGPALWKSVERVAQSVCAGALGAEVPWRVRCDESTNPPPLRASGGIGVEVALRPPPRVEWLVLRITKLP